MITVVWRVHIFPCYGVCSTVTETCSLSQESISTAFPNDGVDTQIVVGLSSVTMQSACPASAPFGGACTQICYAITQTLYAGGKNLDDTVEPANLVAFNLSPPDCVDIDNLDEAVFVTIDGKIGFSCSWEKSSVLVLDSVIEPSECMCLIFNAKTTLLVDSIAPSQQSRHRHASAFQLIALPWSLLELLQV